MKILDTYIGTEPSTVKVDASTELEKLVKKAKRLRNLSFSKKLEAVKKLSIDAMVNAYEQMIFWGNKADSLREVKVIDKNGKVDNSLYDEAKTKYEKYYNIVFQTHPLSYALEQKAGCCRYQGTLFFILGYEAQLGDKHFIQSLVIGENYKTVFNDVVKDNRLHHVCIFIESLMDKFLDYSDKDPKIFERAIEKLNGYKFYSYHKTPEGLVLVENRNKHIIDLEDSK